MPTATLVGRGRIREGLAWLDSALADPDIDAPETDAARVRALAARVVLDSWFGSLDMPDIALIDAALATARKIGDKALLLRALMARGCVALYEATRAERTSSKQLSSRATWKTCGGSARYSNDSPTGRSSSRVICTASCRPTRDANSRNESAITDVAPMRHLHCRCARRTRKTAGGTRSGTTPSSTESMATHDSLSEMTGLMSESIALSLQGDVAGALRAISTRLDGASEIGEYFEYACYPNFVLAHLAAGDAPAAWEASQRALPSVGHMFQVANSYWVVYAALAVGELETAPSVVDIAVSTFREAAGWRLR